MVSVCSWFVPAVVRRFANGRTIEEYYQDGELHRNDGPAVVLRDADGSTMERYYRHGKKHRDGGPAYVRHFADDLFVKRENLGRLCAIPGVMVRPPRPNGPPPPNPA